MEADYHHIIPTPNHDKNVENSGMHKLKGNVTNM